MHRTTSPQLLRNALPMSRRTGPQAAFSLVEVTLAIGIIAFAFVALFGLLPTGMATFRASVDATNDITIMQEMNAMVQVTRWNNIEKLSFKNGGDIYYFDEEGRRTDTKQNRSGQQDVQTRRLYQAKLFVEQAYEPGVELKNPDAKKEFVDAKRIVVVIGDYVRPKSKTDFEAVNESRDIVKSLDVRSRTFMIARMESKNDTEN